MSVSRLVAKSAANECVASLRECEGRRAFAQQLAQTEAAQSTLAEIEVVVREIAMKDASHKARVRAALCALETCSSHLSGHRGSGI